MYVTTYVMQRLMKSIERFSRIVSQALAHTARRHSAARWCLTDGAAICSSPQSLTVTLWGQQRTHRGPVIRLPAGYTYATDWGRVATHSKRGSTFPTARPDPDVLSLLLTSVSYCLREGCLTGSCSGACLRSRLRLRMRVAGDVGLSPRKWALQGNLVIIRTEKVRRRIPVPTYPDMACHSSMGDAICASDTACPRFGRRAPYSRLVWH